MPTWRRPTSRSENSGGPSSCSAPSSTPSRTTRRAHKPLVGATFEPVYARLWLAAALGALGEFREACLRGQEAVMLARADQPARLVMAQIALGVARLNQGDLVPAITSLERAVAVCREWDIVDWLGGAATALGLALVLEGRVSEGRAIAHEGMSRVARARGPSSGHLVTTAEAELEARDPDAALVLAEQALELARRRGEQGSVARALRLLGAIASEREAAASRPAGSRQDGAILFSQALALADELGMRPLVAHCHLGLGKLYRRTGDDAKAAGAPDHRHDDVPRDGHDLLAGEGRRGAGWSRAMTRVERRGFIVGTLSLLAAPLAAEAQQAGKVYRIAMLSSRPLSPQDPLAEVLSQSLRERGWIEGQNILIERRYTHGRPERYPELVAEVLKLPVDVIAVSDSQAAWAAKRATDTTPIVLVNVADAVGQGLVASLARPGGNITGLSNQLEETTGKQLQFLKEIIPTLTRLAVVHNPNNPASNVRNQEAAASRLGIKLIPVVFRAPDDLSPAFMTITQERADAVLLHPASPIAEHWPQFIDFANKQRLPAAGGLRQFVLLGGLTYYGPDSADLLRRGAGYIDKILKGAKPADLPVEQPTKFELVINLKTAKALGLTIPPSVLARADEVIHP